jgi:hypothetical protein
MIRCIHHTPIEFLTQEVSSQTSQRISYVALAALSTFAAALVLPWELALPFGLCAALLALSLPVDDGRAQRVVTEHVVVEEPAPFYRRFRPMAWLNQHLFYPRRAWHAPARAPIYLPAGPPPLLAPRAPAQVHRPHPVAPPCQAPRAPVNVQRACPVAPQPQALRPPMNVHCPAVPIPTRPVRAPVGTR